MILDSRPPHDNVDYFEDLTGDLDGVEDSPVEAVGQRIRLLREEKGLSIEEVSDLTGFDSKRLVMIESGDLKPQLGTVVRLSKALDSALGRILSGEGDRLYSVTRRNDRKPVLRSTSRKDGSSLYKYLSLAPEVKGRNMESFVVELHENPNEEMSVHEGEEFIFVLEGVAKLTIGEDEYSLEPGDSAYYLSTTPHLLTSKDGVSRVLAVVYGR